MDDELHERRRQGLYRRRRRLQSGQGPLVDLDGRRCRNFSSNDYLGLAQDPRLARAASRAARREGCGAGASPLVSGYLPALRSLERRLARWEGAESALVFSSGYLANIAVLTALAGQEDALFSDAWNHASLIDGSRLSRASIHVYRHADLDHLADLLRTQGASARRRILLSDSVFSMDGDLAPLAGLLELAERFDALVVLDEAHATGVLGEHGRGLADLMPPGTPGMTRLIRVGTLSKALGCQGGFICGPQTLISWLINHARPYIFSTALAPPTAAAAQRAVALVQSEPWRRHHLLWLAEQLRGALTRLGYRVGVSHCQIVPVLVGDPNQAVALSRALQHQGLLVPAIRPPSVPEGTARLRISLSAGHSAEDLACLVDALIQLRAEYAEGTCR